MSLTAKDFKSDQEVRWCPGCGDYAILASVQQVMPELGLPRERIVFISGIGCAARFPYYMETYGMHSIHGRAPAIATGLATSRPDLSVWVVTGDGDALSIGGNHLIHALRRNVNLKILLFNNRVYGLTKGQYSPTSPRGQRTGSTPMGSIDQPFNPLGVAIGAEATFVARAIDTDRKHLMEVLRRAAAHRGAAFVEILQNCNIYNDGAFDAVREHEESRIYLRHGQPVRFGRQGERGVRVLDDGSAEIVDVAEVGEGALLVHDEQHREPSLAFALSRLTLEASGVAPVGVFRAVQQPVYDDLLTEQIEQAVSERGPGDLAALLRAEGVDLRTNAQVRRVRQDQGEVVVTASVAGNDVELRAARLLVATGRIPNTDSPASTNVATARPPA
ncbi:MAG: 2-oxoacid:ferredoxin oxidoreductase subunit beta [Thermoleophilia bacterium]